MGQQEPGEVVILVVILLLSLAINAAWLVRIIRRNRQEALFLQTFEDALSQIGGFTLHDGWEEAGY